MSGETLGVAHQPAEEERVEVTLEKPVAERMEFRELSENVDGVAAYTTATVMSVANAANRGSRRTRRLVELFAIMGASLFFLSLAY